MGMKTPLVDVGLSALDTPMQSTMMPTQAPRKAYTVLEPKVATASNALFGSTITYQMPPPVATPLVSIIYHVQVTSYSITAYINYTDSLN